MGLQEYSSGNIHTRGCEPNRHKVSSAQRRGLNVDFFELTEHSQRYDYISALNVFSHLPDPIETLTEWKALLKPGGSLLLETGHSCHLDSRDHYTPYYLPDHLSFANKDIVEGILSRVGFRVVMTKLYRHVLFPDLKLNRVTKELVKIILLRQSRLFDYFPKHPKRDMYILAHLK